MVSPSASQGKVPVLECVREGFGFLARDWRLILPIALIGGAGLAPAQVWAETAAAAQDGGGRLLAMILGVLIQIPFLASFYRRALSRGGDPLALRLGADELNLAGVTAAIAFLFLIVFIGGLIVISMALAALIGGATAQMESLRTLPTMDAARRFGEMLGPEGQTTLVVLMLALAGLMLWLSARLALSYAATVANGRIMTFSTWSWTKGNAWPVAASLVLVMTLGIVLSVVAFLAPGAVLAGVFGEAALQTPGSPANWIATYLSAVTGIFFFHAPYAATTAYLYQGLKPS